MTLIFKNLQEYYEHLEGLSIFMYSSEHIPALIRLRDDTTDDEIKKAATFELLVNDFIASKGKMTGKLKYAGNISSPGNHIFDDHLEQLKARASSTKNAKFKAHYNHILWDSKGKHIQFAQAAVDSYLLMLQSVSIPLIDNSQNHLFETSYQNAFSLAQMINYRKSDVIDLLINELKKENINGYKKCALMRYVTEQGKKIDQAVLLHFFNYATKVVENALYSIYTKEYLGYLIATSQRLGLPQKPYFIHMAELRLTEAAADNEPFVKYDCLESAMGYYQKAGEPTKVEETATLLEETKKQLNFRKHDFSFEDDRLQQWWDEIRKMTDVLIEKGSSELLFEHLILDDTLLPKADLLDNPIIPATFALITVRTFDINRNVDKEKSVGVDQYDLQIKNFTNRHLWLIFSKGIKNGKIGFEQLMQYFRGHTWYGQNFTYETPDGLDRGFNWIDLLAPGFQMFFEQSQVDIETETNNHHGYILVIDSLVLKFEGLLREFSKMLGAQTIERKDSAITECISFEKLLDNDKVKAVLPANDIAFFKYLFTSSGINLRNNIAHCFYSAERYSAILMMLLTVAFLRLGNYEMTITKTET